MGSPVSTATSPRMLAFRLAATSDVDNFFAAVLTELALHPDFSNIVCDIDKPTQYKEKSSTLPAWRVVVCQGPDGESVQFWQPKAQQTRRLDDTRRSWAR